MGALTMKTATPTPKTLSPELKGELILLLTALIWGMSFVTQRLGMRDIGPFTFNAIRFALGSACLIPLIALRLRRERRSVPVLASIRAGLVCGLVLFAGASLQQAGVVYTSAGNAGFITGVYVILVPIFGLFLRKKAPWSIWLGAILALGGLFLLSVGKDFSMGKGDVLVLVGSGFWALHILVIGHYSTRANALILSSTQFLVSSLLSFCVALPLEGLSPSSIRAAGFPILYSGIMSIGVAFTLQIYGQKRAHPGRASIIMSLESLFAALGGMVFLGEALSPRGALGCALILGGMIAAQIDPAVFGKKPRA
jgi:drug/metabolite transporter (DMT)-like permease